MQDFHQLKVWQKAHALTLDIYRATSSFPHSELYGLTNQMRRAAMSIPSNIAEGGGRDSQLQFAHFLQIAFGSACELEYQLLLAHDLGFLNGPEFDRLNAAVLEIKRMLVTLLHRVRNANTSEN